MFAALAGKERDQDPAPGGGCARHRRCRRCRARYRRALRAGAPRQCPNKADGAHGGGSQNGSSRGSVRHSTMLPRVGSVVMQPAASPATTRVAASRGFHQESAAAAVAGSLGFHVIGPSGRSDVEVALGELGHDRGIAVIEEQAGPGAWRRSSCSRSRPGAGDAGDVMSGQVRSMRGDTHQLNSRNAGAWCRGLGHGQGLPGRGRSSCGTAVPGASTVVLDASSIVACSTRRSLNRMRNSTITTPAMAAGMIQIWAQS